MRAFFVTLIRLLTGRVAFERRATLIAAQLATEDAYLHAFGSAEVAAEQIRHFLLAGMFVK